MPFLYTGSRASAASSTASACNGARLLRLSTPAQLPFTYADSVRHAILLCKENGNPGMRENWRDLMAVLIFGAQPARAPGYRPVYENLSGISLYSAIVPVPPRVKKNRAENMPLLPAQRLGRILHIPVIHAAVPDPAGFYRKNRWTSKSALPMSRMLTPAVLGLTFPECGCCCWMM